MNFTIKVNREAFDKAMGAYMDAANGKSAALKPAFETMGRYLLSKYFAENFRQQGKIAQDGRAWERIGLVTAMTRFSGRGAKREKFINIDSAMLAINMGQYPAMIDKGTLRQSFTVNSPGNVFEYYMGNKGLVGTRIEYAEKFQTDRTEPPRKLTDKQWKNAVEKFSDKKVKNQMRGILYGWEKKSHRIPARKLMHPYGILPQAIEDKVGAIGARKAEAILKKIFQGETKK